MLRTLTAAVAMTLLASAAVLADDKKANAPIREIAAGEKDKIDTKAGKATEPTKVTTAEELEKRIPDEDTRKRLAKEVDFKTHTLLVFAWQGSGQDKLEYAVQESAPEKVAFTVTRGLTKDLRSHTHLYVLRNDVKWAVK